MDDGFTTQEVAAAVDVNAKTVGPTLRDWLNSGLPSLADKARSGAPRKITCAQVEKIVEFAMAEPLSAKALLVKHLENGGTKVHVNTLTQALKASGMVWKRTRHSLKKTMRVSLQSCAGRDRRPEGPSGGRQDRFGVRR